MSVQEVGIVVTIGAVMVTVLVALVRAALGQFEKRITAQFQSMNEAQARESELLHRVQQRIEELERHLPLHYVRREDWIRFSAVIDAKLDRVGDRITELAHLALKSRS